MTRTPIPVQIIYTLIQIVNRHDCGEFVTIDGSYVSRGDDPAPYHIDKPFQNLTIHFREDETYILENGVAYLQTNEEIIDGEASES